MTSGACRLRLLPVARSAAGVNGWIAHIVALSGLAVFANDNILTGEVHGHQNGVLGDR